MFAFPALILWLGALFVQVLQSVFHVRMVTTFQETHVNLVVQLLVAYIAQIRLHAHNAKNLTIFQATNA